MMRSAVVLEVGITLRWIVERCIAGERWRRVMRCRYLLGEISTMVMTPITRAKLKRNETCVGSAIKGYGLVVRWQSRLIFHEFETLPKLPYKISLHQLLTALLSKAT